MVISNFRKMINYDFGFRECAVIMKIAQATQCTIKIIINDKVGTSKSILSLASLGLTQGKSVLIQLIDGDQSVAFHDINNLIDQGWKADAIK